MCDQCSLVGLCVQDYKSLCAAVMISATLVNTQTDRHAKAVVEYLNIRINKYYSNPVGTIQIPEIIQNVTTHTQK